jgi:hypothetical protein
MLLSRPSPQSFLLTALSPHHPALITVLCPFSKMEGLLYLPLAVHVC